jgi:hypothetical protein
MPEITTERLLLRYFRAEGLGPHGKAVDDDPAVTWHHKRWSLAESLRRWAERVEHWEQHGFGMWIVEERATGDVLGHFRHPANGGNRRRRARVLPGPDGVGPRVRHGVRGGVASVRLRADQAPADRGGDPGAKRRVPARAGEGRHNVRGKGHRRGFPVRKYQIDRARWRARERGQQ